MIPISDHIEKYRIKHGEWRSDSTYGMTGAWRIMLPCCEEAYCISTPGDDEYPWEHVSVSLKERCPTWNEMCFIKNLFWMENETVIQIHPAKEDYVNNHQFCLHLWRPTKAGIPLPPKVLV